MNIIHKIKHLGNSNYQIIQSFKIRNHIDAWRVIRHNFQPLQSDPNGLSQSQVHEAPEDSRPDGQRYLFCSSQK